jgi:hypothetical protein
MGRFSLAGPIVATILESGRRFSSCCGVPFSATISLKPADRALLDTTILLARNILRKLKMGNARCNEVGKPQEIAKQKIGDTVEIGFK